MAKPLAKLVALLTHKRRWAQFSLRNAFVLLTAFLIWFGFHANRTHKQRLAIRSIEKMGGWIAYDSFEPFIDVDAVVIAHEGSQWTDDSIKNLFPAIRQLKADKIAVGEMASYRIEAELRMEFPSSEFIRNSPPRAR